MDLVFNKTLKNSTIAGAVRELSLSACYQLKKVLEVIE